MSTSAITAGALRTSSVKLFEDRMTCPACGSHHLTIKEWTEDGPKFDCDMCAVKPVLNMMGNDDETKLFWSW